MVSLFLLRKANRRNRLKIAIRVFSFIMAVIVTDQKCLLAILGADGLTVNSSAPDQIETFGVMDDCYGAWSRGFTHLTGFRFIIRKLQN